MLRYLLQVLLVLLLGTGNGPVHDLRKQPTREDRIRDIECFIQKHFYIIMMLFLACIMIVFIIFCFSIVGISAVESGGMRNFIAGGV